MYEKLVKALRYCAFHDCRGEGANEVGCTAAYSSRTDCDTCNQLLQARASDAIEELEEKVQAYAETLYAYENPWTMITSRPMTTEEREEVEYVLSDDEAIVYTCPLPDDGQEILTCDKYGTVRLDTFENDPDYGCGLEENGDMDGIVAWMSLPKPPKEVKK